MCFIDFTDKIITEFLFSLKQDFFDTLFKENKQPTLFKENKQTTLFKQTNKPTLFMMAMVEAICKLCKFGMYFENPCPFCLKQICEVCIKEKHIFGCTNVNCEPKFWHQTISSGRMKFWRTVRPIEQYCYYSCQTLQDEGESSKCPDCDSPLKLVKVSDDYQRFEMMGYVYRLRKELVITKNKIQTAIQSML